MHQQSLPKISRWENDFYNSYARKLKSGAQLQVETERGGRVLSSVSVDSETGLLQITRDDAPVLPILLEEVLLYISSLYYSRYCIYSGCFYN